MRVVILLASWLLAGVCQAAGFAGSYAMDHAYGRISARLDQKGDLLSGKVNFMGKAQMDLAGRVIGGRASGTIAAKDGDGVFEAVMHGDVLTLTIARSSAPEGPLAGVPLQLRRIGSPPENAAPVTAPNSPKSDPRLVGSWTYDDFLAGGSASQSSEEHMEFGADGSYAYARTEPGNGLPNRSFSARNRDKTGRTRWRAQAGVLYLLGNEGWDMLGRYTLSDDGKKLRIVYRSGSRKLWSRR